MRGRAAGAPGVRGRGGRRPRGAHHGLRPPRRRRTGPPSSAAPSGSAGAPSGYADMQKKVDAAESAAAAADRDASSTADK
ncbi:hypothetical protein ACQ4WX_32510 [Streptomyces lasalocidi]